MQIRAEGPKLNDPKRCVALRVVVMESICPLPEEAILLMGRRGLYIIGPRRLLAENKSDS